MELTETFLIFPEKPDKLIVNATPVFNTVSLTWSVTYDGNSPITAFSVTHRDKAGRVRMYSVTPEQGNKLRINGLALKVKHFFTVEAENQVGKSEPATAAVTLVSSGNLLLF